MKPQDIVFFRVLIRILVIHQLLATVSLAGDVPEPIGGPAGSIGSEANPFIGTGGLTYLCGNNFPGATVPFGMVRLSPDTVSPLGKRATNTSGYYYRDSASWDSAIRDWRGPAPRTAATSW